MLNPVGGAAGTLGENDVNSDTSLSMYLGSAEEVFALINKFAGDFSSSVIKFLQGNGSNANIFISQLIHSTSIYNSISSENSSQFAPVTLSLFQKTNPTEQNLRELFNNSSPHLGDSFAESEEMLKELSSLGIDANAILRVPVYVKNYDAKDKLVSESISYLTGSERAGLDDRYQKSASNIFSGASDYKINSSDGSYSIWTTLDRQKNYFITEADLLNILSLMKDHINIVTDEFFSFLEKVDQTLKQLSDFQQRTDSSSRQIKSTIQSASDRKIETLVSEFELLRTAVKDRRRLEKQAVSPVKKPDTDLFKLLEIFSKNEIYKIQELGTSERSPSNQKPMPFDENFGKYSNRRQLNNADQA